MAAPILCVHYSVDKVMVIQLCLPHSCSIEESLARYLLYSNVNILF